MKSDKPVVTGLVDGNAFAVMGAVRRALRRAGRPKEEIAEYTERAMAGNYDNLLCVSMEYVDFDLREREERDEPLHEDDY